MKNLTKKPTSLVDDDKKFLTSFQPAKKQNLFIDTGILTLPFKLKRGMIIFLVDDDLLYLTAMKHYLLKEIMPLTVKTFQTGEAALLEMKQQPDIVILDYYLDTKVSSAEDGIRILKQIKSIDPDIKVIMLSGQDKMKVALNCLKHGAFEYVSKGETAFVKIKTILMNIAANKLVFGKMQRQVKFFKIAYLFMFLMLVLFYLLSH